jgi:protein-S-isoprenylcysteine O-methyltransferase Ste14
MNVETASRLLLPVLLAAFLALDLALPLARLRRTTGTWGVPVLRPRDPRERALSLAFVLILLALGALAVRFSLGGAAAVGAAVPPAPVAAAGFALLLAGLAVVGVAQRQMGASLRVGLPTEPTALVLGGLFQRIRNPIFLGLLLGLAGVVLVVPSAASLAVWLAAAVAIVRQTRLEEEHLEARHGEAYRSYASRVGRFLPGVGRLPVRER